MAKPTFPKLAERVFAVRAAWRRTIPVRVRVEAIRRAASLRDDSVPVIKGEGPDPVGSGTQPSLVGGPPVRRIEFDARVA